MYQATRIQKMLIFVNELYELGEYQRALDVLTRVSDLIIKEIE